MPIPELKGGRCSICGKIVCRSHLFILKKGIVCFDCLKLKNPFYNFFKGVKRPLLISIISILYLLTGITSLIEIKNIGYIDTLLFIIFCSIMGYGLWTLKKWARFIEIIICYIQIFTVIILFSIKLFIAPDFQELWKLSVFITFLFLIALTIFDIYIIRYLRKPEIKIIFQQ